MALVQEVLIRPEATKAFEKMLEKIDINNYSMQTSIGVEKGKNFAALVAQIQVDGYNKKGNKVQKTFIVKSAPYNDEFRNASNIREVFIREIYVYSKLFCKFDLIQKEKCVENPFKSYPEYYTSTSQVREESIVIRHLKPDGYKHWNREIPVDYSHASMIIREYGRLHALSFAIRDQKPGLFDEIIDNTHEMCFQNFQKETIRGFSKDRVEQALKSLDPVKDKLVYNKLKEFSENMFEILSKCIDFKAAGQYGVVSHVDCSLSNIMFKYEDLENTTKPTKLCFLDWQLSCISSPAVDLSTFIFSSTDKKLRDEHYNDLIDEYYTSLCSMLEKLGTDAEIMLPFTVLQQHLKKFSIFGFFLSTLLLIVQLTNKEDIPDVMHDTTQFCFKLKNHESYNSRMRDIILDFDRFGYNFNFV